MFTKQFWQDTIERTVRTVAQTLLGVMTADGVPRVDINWKGALAACSAAGIACVLMSLLASGNGKDTASFIK